MVSTLSPNQQFIKLNQEEELEVFREYYLTVVFLECVWETDNFILLERRSGPETIKDDVICQGLSTVEYQSIETIVGDNKSMDIIMDKTPEEDTGTMRTENLSSMENDCKQVDDSEPSSKNLEHEETTSSSWLARPNLPTPKPELRKKVAFISVKRPEP